MPTYLCSAQEVEDSSKVKVNPLDEQVNRMFVEFEDVMLNELSKGLPPRRAVNHKIELM